jgi:hypothetical protein
MMNRKTLSLGMIIPLAAAGAVATAPNASAAPRHYDRVSCRLDAEAVHRDLIKVDFRLRGGDRGWWKVEIKQNGREIEKEYVNPGRGSARVVDYTWDRRGTDWFKATAKNLRTGQKCVAYDAVWAAHR